MGDKFLRHFLSLLYLPHLILVRTHFAICPDWHGRWRASRLARFNADPVGKPPGRILLHSEPLARSSSGPRNRGPLDLRLVARDPSRPQRAGWATSVDDGIFYSAFPRHRRRSDRILSRLRHRCASPVVVSRTTPLSVRWN